MPLNLGAILADDSARQFDAALMQRQQFRNQDRADEAEYSRGLAEGMMEQPAQQPDLASMLGGGEKTEEEKKAANDTALFKSMQTVAESLGAPKTVTTTMSGARLKGYVAGKIQAHNDKMKLAEAMQMQQYRKAQMDQWASVNQARADQAGQREDLGRAAYALSKQRMADYMANPEKPQYAQGPGLAQVIYENPNLATVAGPSLIESLGQGGGPAPGSVVEVPGAPGYLFGYNSRGSGSWIRKPDEAGAATGDFAHEITMESGEGTGLVRLPNGAVRALPRKADASPLTWSEKQEVISLQRLIGETDREINKLRLKGDDASVNAALAMMTHKDTLEKRLARLRARETPEAAPAEATKPNPSRFKIETVD